MAANNPDQNAKQDLTIQGKTFKIPLPYAIGACELTEGEAAALNQTYAENVRNNFAQQMKRAAEGDTPKELTQEDLDAYTDGYEFGKRTGGARGPRDPIGTEERRLALAAVKAHVAAKGKNWKDLSEDKQEELVNTVVASGKFREKAAEIVRQRQEAAEATKDLDLDLAA